MYESEERICPYLSLSISKPREWGPALYDYFCSWLMSKRTSNNSL